MRHLIIFRRTWRSSPAAAYDHQIVEFQADESTLQQAIIDVLEEVPTIDGDVALYVNIVQVIPLGSDWSTAKAARAAKRRFNDPPDETPEQLEGYDPRA